MSWLLRILMITQAALWCGLGFSQNWKQVGEGLSCSQDGSIYELHGDSINDLLLGRGWLTWDGECDSMRNVTIWNRHEWERLGINTTNSNGYSVGTFNGQIVSQGFFWGGDSESYLGVWNGLLWDSIPNGPNNWGIWAIEQFGDWLYVGGTFTKCGGDSTKLVCRWNGSEWEKLIHPFSPDEYAVCSAIQIYKDTLYIGGGYYGNEQKTGRANCLSSVYNFELNEVGVGLSRNSIVESMCVHNDTLWIGGAFPEGNFLGHPTTFLLTYANGELKPYHTQPPGRITGLKSYQGNLYIGGWFRGQSEEPEWAGCMNVAMIHNGEAYCLNYSYPNTGNEGEYDLGARDIEIWNDTLYVGGDVWAFGETIVRNVAYLDWPLSKIMDFVEQEQPTTQDTISSISIFPNPTNGFLIIASPDTISSIDIFDVTGRIILSFHTNSKKVTIDTKTFEKGSYICQLKFTNGQTTKRRFIRSD